MFTDMKNSSQMQKAFALFELLAQKDILTALHSLNVACLIKTLATNYIETELNKDNAFIAGLLHDIGKLKLPDYFFSNYVIEDQDDKNIIMEHPAHSKAILENMDFEQDIINAVFQHHERFDGSGYPSGLKKFQISPAARLLGIVDSFSAIHEDRPYRKGADTSRTIKILLSDQGLYDADMLLVFIKNLNQVFHCTKQELEVYKKRLLHVVKSNKN